MGGWVVDRLIADPRRGHPVAAFGRCAGQWESAVYADRRAAGVVFTAAAVGATVMAGTGLRAVCARRPWAHGLLVAGATWTVLGGTSLVRIATDLGAAVERGDLDRARSLLPALCGRDPAGLDAAELARAAVESVAENTSDAVVAPLFWGAVAGLPGLLGYRAVNTLDAMVGHRTARYARFGWASARLDDLANLAPARLTGVLAAVAAPVVGGRVGTALRVMRSDGGHHPSPNSGRCEAAFAGALGVRLGGTNRYGDLVEQRGRMGTGRPPEPVDVTRAARLSRAVAGLTVLLAATAAAARGRRCVPR